MNMPQPSPEAQQASAALLQKIAETIRQGDGWISFARYMEMALYTPQLGYYSSEGVKVGRQGDFVTAPEISPLFGQSLAHAVMPLMAQSLPHILEIGAGSGQLAYDMLSEMARQGAFLERYDILDLSGNLKQKQQQKLANFPMVRWLERLPEAFTGVIVGNEVLDAMPVQRVMKKNALWHELGVSLTDGRLVFQTRPADEALLDQIARQIPMPESLPEGYVTEVHAHACALARSLADMQQAGRGSAAILIDYGYPAYEYYLPAREQGTLMSYYRQRASTDLFGHVGLQDISAHVDFSAIAQTVAESNVEVLCYTPQAAFLIACGITDHLLRISPEDAAQYLPAAGKAQMLLSPSEMGDLFKVLIFGNLPLPAHLQAIDRSGRL